MMDRLGLARVRLTFRQRDVTAAIKAVEAAGHAVARIEIDQDGKIIIIPAGSPEEQRESEINEWDVALGITRAITPGNKVFQDGGGTAPKDRKLSRRRRIS